MQRINKYVGFHPFRIEALYCFGIDVLVFCVFMAIDMNLFSILYMYFVGYVVLEMLFSYRVGLLSVLEVLCHGFICEELQFLYCKEEWSPSGHFGSIIPKLFSKYKRVERTKVFFKRKNGSTIKLRCIFYGEPTTWFHHKYGETIPYEKVEYGKFSRVIISREFGRINQDGLWNRYYSP
ncbi:MAG: hypothetical protein IJ744_01375 [Lachnospiraceae bacterium]|nr:hypothetical protein [Lachnospiraceae bacterium]